MIGNAILGPALVRARAENIDTRMRWASPTVPGPLVAPTPAMIRALNEYRDAPTHSITNRWADGLSGIDRAVAKVRVNWMHGGAGLAFPDAAVTELLLACQSWLAGARPHITSWRRDVIRELHAKVGWCYSCDYYARQALLHIATDNGAGHATPVDGPLALAALTGNPYNFPADYTLTAPVALTGAMNAEALNPHRWLLRGDTRGPGTIHGAGGFLPENIAAVNRWRYRPFFAGAALRDTISTTSSRLIAINASPAAYIGGATPHGPLPAWLAATCAAALPAAGPPLVPIAASPISGFVYEFANINALRPSLSMVGTAYGHEEVFLSIPNAAISRWWVVRDDYRTVGPFLWPPAALAPAAAWLSGAGATNGVRRLAAP